MTGQTLSLAMGGEKFNVSPGWGRYSGTFVLPGQARPVKSAAGCCWRSSGTVAAARADARLRRMRKQCRAFRAPACG